MAGQCGPDQVPPGAIALLGGAIRYALGACAEVMPTEMTRPTPCADWDLAALLAHLATSMADLESALRTGSADPWAGDPGPASPDGPRRHGRRRGTDGRRRGPACPATPWRCCVTRPRTC